MLTHGNVTWNAVNFLTCADFRSDDVTIAIAPFFRVGGTGVNVLPVLFVGGTVVVPDDPRPDGLLRLMEQHRVTVGFGNPDLLDALTQADRWPSADLSSVRFVITGGAPVPERLIRTYLDRGLTLQQGYGLSEAAPLVLLLDAGTGAREDRLRREAAPVRRHPDHRRRPDDEVAAGETGELLVRGPNVMAGYWRRPARRARLPHRGRLAAHRRCGPHGRRRLRLDRRSPGCRDSSRPARSSIPGDVERVLLAHPAVADAGVVGVAGPRRRHGRRRVRGPVFGGRDDRGRPPRILPSPLDPASGSNVDLVRRTAAPQCGGQAGPGRPCRARRRRIK